METMRVMIEQLERKLIIAGRKPLSKNVVIGIDCLKLGGSGRMLASALSALGITPTCLGSVGFANQPQYDWVCVKKTVGLGKLTELFLKGDVIALVDWANLRHAENMWEGILEDIIKPSGRRDFMFFFDLGDPTKKTPLEIDEVLDIISCFSFYGHVTLGLNDNEAVAIWSSLTGLGQNGSVEEAGRFIHYAMDIDRLLIHMIDKTTVFQKKLAIELPGRVIANPKIQAGGGHNLNAGYLLGLLSGFSLEESMILAMAASGSYVQEGKSATIAEIRQYLSVWRSGLDAATEVTPTHKAA